MTQNEKKKVCLNSCVTSVGHKYFNFQNRFSMLPSYWKKASNFKNFFKFRETYNVQVPLPYLKSKHSRFMKQRITVVEMEQKLYVFQIELNYIIFDVNTKMLGIVFAQNSFNSFVFWLISKNLSKLWRFFKVILDFRFNWLKTYFFLVT